MIDRQHIIAKLRELADELETAPEAFTTLRLTEEDDYEPAPEGWRGRLVTNMVNIELVYTVSQLTRHDGD